MLEPLRRFQQASGEATPFNEEAMLQATADAANAWKKFQHQRFGQLLPDSQSMITEATGAMRGVAKSMGHFAMSEDLKSILHEVSWNLEEAFVIVPGIVAAARSMRSLLLKAYHGLCKSTQQRVDGSELLESANHGPTRQSTTCNKPESHQKRTAVLTLGGLSGRHSGGADPNGHSILMDRWSDIDALLLALGVHVAAITAFR